MAIAEDRRTPHSGDAADILVEGLEHDLPLADQIVDENDDQAIGFGIDHQRASQARLESG